MAVTAYEYGGWFVDHPLVSAATAISNNRSEDDHNRWEMRDMSRYFVTFFKHLLSSDGHIFKSPQQTFEIRRAKSVDRAVQAAERRYERLCKLTPWTLHADTLEVEVDGDNVDRTAPVCGGSADTASSLLR